MRRRGGPGPRVVAFDEEFDDGPLEGDEPPVQDQERVRTPDATVTRQGHHRRWIAGGGVLAIMVGGLTLGGEIEDRREVERLTAAPGGLVPWGTTPPREL